MARKKASSHVVIANRLGDGRVVYLARRRTPGSERVSDPAVRVADNDEPKPPLLEKAGLAAEGRQEVVGVGADRRRAPSTASSRRCDSGK